jgi:hypothetical protein
MPPKRVSKQKPYERANKKSAEKTPELVCLDAGNEESRAGNVENPFVNLLARTADFAVSETRSEFELPREIVSCVDDDLALHVAPEICSKIWRNEYINLSCLLKRDVATEKGSNLTLNEHGMLEIAPKPSRQIRNIREWTDAFLVFMAIYIKKYPSKSGELLQYIATIREAESRNSSSLCWKSYDENFRLRQAVSPMSWSKINPDLWLKLMTGQSVQGNFAMNKVVKSNIQNSSSIKVCFDFNSPRGCRFPNCRFSHRCILCKGDHNQMKCNQSSKKFTFRK